VSCSRTSQHHKANPYTAINAPISSSFHFCMTYLISYIGARYCCHQLLNIVHGIRQLKGSDAYVVSAQTAPLVSDVCNDSVTLLHQLRSLSWFVFNWVLIVWWIPTTKTQYFKFHYQNPKLNLLGLEKEFYWRDTILMRFESNYVRNWYYSQPKTLRQWVYRSLFLYSAFSFLTNIELRPTLEFLTVSQVILSRKT